MGSERVRVLSLWQNWKSILLFALTPGETGMREEGVNHRSLVLKISPLHLKHPLPLLHPLPAPLLSLSKAFPATISPRRLLSLQPAAPHPEEGLHILISTPPLVISAVPIRPHCSSTPAQIVLLTRGVEIKSPASFSGCRDLEKSAFGGRRQRRQ